MAIKASESGLRFLTGSFDSANQGNGFSLQSVQPFSSGTTFPLSIVTNLSGSPKLEYPVITTTMTLQTNALSIPGMFFDVDANEVLDYLGFSSSDTSGNLTFSIISQASINNSRAYMWINNHTTDISWGELEMSSNKSTISHTFSMTRSHDWRLGCLFDAENAPSESSVTFYKIYLENDSGKRYTFNHSEPSFITSEYVTYKENENSDGALWFMLKGDQFVGGATEGAQGATGFQGEIGAQGELGATGSIGLQGATGAQGATGFQGEQGSTGTIGSQGATGSIGVQGEIGSQGAQGSTGIKGDRGEQGATGGEGATGTQGLQGSTGVTGAQGITGAQGLPGSAVYKGDVGATGYQGAQGSPGSGFQGATGYGAQGATGAAGTMSNNLSDIQLNLNSVASPTDGNAQNSGIVVKATNDKTLLYYDVSENYTAISTVQFDVANATQQAKITASDGAASDYFGDSVAIYGDYAIIGAYRDDDDGSDSGSAYIFVRNGTSWSQQAKLTASDAAASDRFGHSVGIYGDYAIIEAYKNDDDGIDSGSAYIFVRNGTSWSQQAKLTASDASTYDEFGRHGVGIYGDYCIVGSYNDDDDGGNSGSAYIFVRNGTSWSQQAKLTASDAAAGDFFGVSVGIYGDYVIIGADRDDDAGNNSGSAYIFVRNGTSWSQQAKLTASDAAAGDQFGYSVGIYGHYAIIGAFGADSYVGSNSGCAYIFVRNGTSWSQQAKLTASDLSSYDSFGFSVAIYGNHAVVSGHSNDDNGSNSGSAYIFTRSGTTWSQQKKLLASDPANNDQFGKSVAMNGGYIICGATYEDQKGFKCWRCLYFSGKCDPGIRC